MSSNFGQHMRRILLQALQQFLRNRGGDQTARTSQRTSRVEFPFGSSPAPKPSKPLDTATTTAPTGNSAREYRMPASGLPTLSYAPNPDGQADPGEVVWAWVPYEEDASQGKDRPVLIISEVTGGFLGVQMTSKDHSHDGAHEDRYGRTWMDIGSGPWDSRGRDSEVRLDRLLFLPPQGIRREGATLDKTRFLEVAEALVALHS